MNKSIEYRMTNLEYRSKMNKHNEFKESYTMKLQSIFLLSITYLLTVYSISYSQIQNTWELIKRHEIYFKVRNQTDTSLTDTTIIEKSQNAFYKYTNDSVYIYNLDYEDSKEKNCYMLWINPYKLLNDSTLDIGGTQYSEVQISATFKIVNDTLIYTEKCWEDQPDYIYHQTKVLYFFRIDCFGLPPIWWPQTECHSLDAVNYKRLTRPVVSHKSSNSQFNLLGQSIIAESSGVKVLKGTKSITIKRNRK